MLYVVIVTFIIGYAAIIFEHPLKLDKTVPALIMAALCWAFISLGHLDLYNHHGHIMSDHGNYYKDGLTPNLLHHIGKTAEILIFLIGAMTIVELVDLHKGFSVITDRIKTTKKSTMLWIIMVLAFFLSATLDNLTCTIVLVSLLRRLVPKKEERIFFVSLVILAANAGGAWSPIGDVTTTMLWIGDRVTTIGLVVALLLPSIVCAVVPTFIMSRMSYMKGNITIEENRYTKEAANSGAVTGGKIMLICGVAGLVFVPIFKTVTHLPPYVGMMFSLGIVWLVSEYLHPDEDLAMKHKLSAHNALSRIELSSILFFLGILMGVAALESLGVLRSLADAMSAVFPATNIMPGVTGTDLVIAILGLGSALIDNVPLVAAAMGMYAYEAGPGLTMGVDYYPLDHKLWHFLAFSAGTGGSMLVIGSAAGVAAMGMERIDFMWYVRKIAWLAIVGFMAGALVFLLWYPLVGEWILSLSPEALDPDLINTGGGHGGHGGGHGHE